MKKLERILTKTLSTLTEKEYKIGNKKYKLIKNGNKWTKVEAK